MNETTKSSKGTFKKGSRGNPAGRPAGSRNKSTLACEELLEGQAQKLTQKAVELALEGNILALRLCLEQRVTELEDTKHESLLYQHELKNFVQTVGIETVNEVRPEGESNE